MKAWAGSVLQPYYLNQFLQVDEVYRDLASAQNDWILSVGTSCIPECGVCCNEYNPDITEQEALYTAVSILFEHWESFSSHESLHAKNGLNDQKHNIVNSTLHASLENTCSVSNVLKSIFPNFYNDAVGCPFRSKRGPHFCMIYSGRPLICRLFGAAGDRGKDGTVRFSPCKVLKEKLKCSMNTVSQQLLYTKQPRFIQELHQHAFAVPIMSDYALRLHGYENLAKIKPLVISAVEKLLFYLQVRGDKPLNPRRAA